MQSKRKSKSDTLTLKTVMVFLGLMFIAYLPISSFLFFIKNDAFSGYFPAKFFISEGIHHNNFPWWNPYISFGIPQYGDMNSGFYSPFTWIFASLLGYNAYTFTGEVLLYLFLAGLGMFRLCRSFKFTKSVSYIAGAAYLCSGYMVGHLQHFNWISGAAFLPWAIWAYHHMMHKFSMKNAVVAAIFMYLFVSSAHPGLIIGGLYFFLAYIVYVWLEKKKEAEHAFNPGSFIKKHLWMLVPFLLLCIGLIYGYSEIIPHMTRGGKFESVSQLSNAFTIPSLISVLIPLATAKANGFFLTDISMRNIYFGLIPLFFLITGIRSGLQFRQKYFLGIAAAFFLLSLGGPLHYLRLHLLPLMGHIRMPGELMIFSSIALILVAAQSMNDHVMEKREFSSVYHRTYFFLQLIFAAAIGIGILGIIFSGDGILYHFGEILSSGTLNMKLKKLVDSFSIFDLLFLQGLFQLFILRAIKEFVLKRQYRMLIRLAFLEMIVATLLQLPFTGVGKASVQQVQSQLNRSPEGIPQPFMLPVKNNHFSVGEEDISLLGDWTFYNKQIGTEHQVFYPVALRNTQKILDKHGRNVFAEKPYLFHTNDTNQLRMRITSFKTTMIDIAAETTLADTLVLQQNNYPKWVVLINGEHISPINYHGNFMAVALQPGKNDVKFYYTTGAIEKTFSFSKYFFLLLLIYLIVIWIKRSSPS